jgi:hypothetical protein
MSRSQWLEHFKGIWKPGEHVSIWGPTRSGKTYVCSELANLRKYYALLISKQQDQTFDKYTDFSILKSWKDRHYRDFHVMVWPYGKDMRDTELAYQRESAYMMGKVYDEKGWTMQIDDARMMRHLHLTEQVKMMFAHCASQGTSLVYNDQRPFSTIQEALDQTTYNLMFHQKDRRDVWRMAEANGENPFALETLNNQLQRYEFLFIPVYDEVIIVRND